MSAASPLRVGFLGAGHIARTYAAALARLPDVEIVGVCGRRRSAAEAFAREHAATAVPYDDLSTMLARERLDALWVCLPPGAHHGQAELAARHGVHLMLEKPIALTLARAESIRDAVREAGVTVQIGYHMRHSEPAVRLVRMLRDGTAGRALLFQGRFYVNSLFPSWWRDPDMGGGQLVEQSIHLYDLARYFFGDAVVVSGHAANLAHTRFPDYRVDDVSASTIRFANGAIASLSAANMWAPRAGSVQFTVLCERILVDFSSPERAEFVYHDGLTTEEVDTGGADVRRETVEGGDLYQELCCDFVHAIRTGTSARSGIDDGVEGLRLVRAVEESSRSLGARVRLQPVERPRLA